MKTRCKHRWSFSKFNGDPFDSHDMCLIDEGCNLCGNERDRPATYAECAAEVARLTCSSCGYLKEDHDQQHGNPCIKLLGVQVRNLEARLATMEDWRHR